MKVGKAISNSILRCLFIILLYEFNQSTNNFDNNKSLLINISKKLKRLKASMSLHPEEQKTKLLNKFNKKLENITKKLRKPYNDKIKNEQLGEEDKKKIEEEYKKQLNELKLDTKNTKDCWISNVRQILGDTSTLKKTRNQ